MEITVEQALKNIRAILDNHVGKKQEHVILDASYSKIIAEIGKVSNIT